MRSSRRARTFMSIVVAALAILHPAAADETTLPVAPVGRTLAWPSEHTIEPWPPAATEPQTSRRDQDAPDASTEPQTHAIYFVPKDGIDELLDTSGAIAGSLRSVRAWFAAQTGKRPRLDMVIGTQTADITFVRGTNEGITYTSLRRLVEELQERGFTAEHKRYVVYAALNRGATCGEGYYAIPGVRTGRYSAVYLNSNEACRARAFGDGTAAGAGYADAVVAHEWLHNEGLVPVAAPRHCPVSAFHVCTGPLAAYPTLDPEQTDLMFPYVSAPLSGKKLDIGNDDYYKHSWPHIADLEDSSYLCEPSPTC